MASRISNKIYCGLIVAVFYSNICSGEPLVQAALDEKKQSTQHSALREAKFEQTEYSMAQQLSELKAKKDGIEQQIEALKKQFTINEAHLVELKQQEQVQASWLNQAFSSLQIFAQELLDERANLPAGLDKLPHSNIKLDDALKRIKNANLFSSIDELSALWQGLLVSLKNSSQMSSLLVNVRDNDGLIAEQKVLRLGHLALVNDKGYLLWLSDKNQANLAQNQPQDMPTFSDLFAATSGQFVLFDPSKGFLLERLVLTKSLYKKIEQAGLIGKIILLLFILGIAISVIRGGVLLSIRFNLHRQVKSLEKVGPNALGRMLNLLQDNKNDSIEILELKMMEIIIDEQQRLEKGLSLLKLLAAMAPMLGLLGTVTGMIDTFQVMSDYGKSDASLMASGISMALITTVMGLIAAMPLLLAHNILSSQLEIIQGTLEKTGISLVAQQYEKLRKKNKTNGCHHGSD